MTTSDQVQDIAAACVKAQQALKPAIKDAVNPAFRSKYADLTAILEAARVYATHGVAIFQEATTAPSGVSVATRLIHTSGQWIAFDPLTVPVGGKGDAHGIGSATTYAKRYALAAALSIASDDDDGNAAAGVAAAKVAAKPPSPAPDGFDNWLLDLEVVAGKGTEALQAAWSKSQPYMRKYLTDTNNAHWEAVKARAATVPGAAKVSA